MPISVKTVAQHEGLPVQEAILRSAAGVEVSILSLGARVRDWRIPLTTGVRSVVLGYPDVASYFQDTNYYGAIVGRVANRIRDARFQMDGHEYKLAAARNSRHLLHGGPAGLWARNWRLQTTGDAVLLTYLSPDSEMGFPGEVEFSVSYRLLDFCLDIQMRAKTNKKTPINLVQHSYFNLAGHGDILDHVVQISAAHFTPVNEDLIPTGEIRSVANSIYDLNRPKTLRDPDGGARAYDVNMVLDPARQARDPVVQVVAPDRSLTLRLWTDQPGLQFYNSVFQNFTGLCFEDQAFPDSVHQPHFPSIWVTPERPYSHHCRIEIAPEPA